MASLVTNKGAFLLTGGVAGAVNYLADTLKAVPLKSTYTPNQDVNFMGDISAQEVVATGYTGGFGGAGRQTLASKTVTEDDVNNQVEFDAADITLSSVGGVTNDTIGAFAIIKEITNDAASPVIAIVELATPITTNGSDVSIAWGADGLFKTTT